ncbi:MAG TPA: bifunctional adenosylcobinamide kinase/adenosylcobinamide-phosphate guanylyltransferase [Xanthobacteraceae bacterium]|nr:bifunctional adenosylcobinamide kinase/adenosylcobinamide-phosphate guanylyltransferase [Xanthobacteraceae bacterium]
MAGPAAAGGRLTLVLGGARSGKSRYAESLVTALPPPWLYVATAEAGDSEMVARVAAHQARRGPSWTTIETPRNVAETLGTHADTPTLVDCLTLWLSNVMLADADVDAEIEQLDEALARAAAPIVLVANEVGFGIVPDSALGRRFRDLQGLLNQRIAARADRVVLVVAGVPLTLKGSP